MKKVKRRGIIQAGADCTLMHPITQVVRKKLLPVYDKPMIYYPLSTLMLAGIREILIITTPRDFSRFEALLGDGKHLGLELHYAVEPSQLVGIAQSFVIGANFLDGHPAALVLGDNLFYGHDLMGLLDAANNREQGATIFAYRVADPEHYCVVGRQKDSDGEWKVMSLEEKPVKPVSNEAVPGLYFYDAQVVDRVRQVRPSPRGELEITELNRLYLEAGELQVELMGRGLTWLDMSTCDSLHEAASYIRTIEKRQGLKIGCPEEVARMQGWISDADLLGLASPLRKSGYGAYLESLVSCSDK